MKYEILVFLMNFIFLRRNEIILPFSKLIIGKVKFFNALVRVFAQIYANMWCGGGQIRFISNIGWLGKLILKEASKWLWTHTLRRVVA